MMEEEEGRWENLANDILALILKHLDTQADLSRFSSVCKPWRSFASSTKPQPLFPLSLPSLEPDSLSFSLSPTLLYVLSLYPHPHPTHNPSSNSWLVKVSETGNSNNKNQWTLLNPLTQHKLYLPSGVFHHPINLLDFGNFEVGRSYQLQPVDDGGEFTPHIRKVAVKTGEQEFTVLVLYGYRKIALWKLGDNNWKIIVTGQDDVLVKRQYFDDVIFFAGKFYAVDPRGRLASIDPTTFELVQVIPPFEDYDFRCSYLVESNFRLYLVNKIVNPRPASYYVEEEDVWVVENTSVTKPLGLKVYVFEEREKCWKRVESLGNRVLFVSQDAKFSVGAEDLGWSKGNCIYFEGVTWFSDDLGFGLNAGVYSLDDGTISIFSSFADPLTKIFWPPSSWFL